MKLQGEKCWNRIIEAAHGHGLKLERTDAGYRGSTVSIIMDRRYADTSSYLIISAGAGCHCEYACDCNAVIKVRLSDHDTRRYQIADLRYGQHDDNAREMRNALEWISAAVPYDGKEDQRLIDKASDEKVLPTIDEYAAYLQGLAADDAEAVSSELVEALDCGDKLWVRQTAAEMWMEEQRDTTYDAWRKDPIYDAIDRWLKKSWD